MESTLVLVLLISTTLASRRAETQQVNDDAPIRENIFEYHKIVRSHPNHTQTTHYTIDTNETSYEDEKGKSYDSPPATSNDDYSYAPQEEPKPTQAPKPTKREKIVISSPSAYFNKPRLFSSNFWRPGDSAEIYRYPTTHSRVLVNDRDPPTSYYSSSSSNKPVRYIEYSKQSQLSPSSVDVSDLDGHTIVTYDPKQGSTSSASHDSDPAYDSYGFGEEPDQSSAPPTDPPDTESYDFGDDNTNSKYSTPGLIEEPEPSPTTETTDEEEEANLAKGGQLISSRWRTSVPQFLPDPFSDFVETSTQEVRKIPKLNRNKPRKTKKLQIVYIKVPLLNLLDRNIESQVDEVVEDPDEPLFPASTTLVGSTTTTTTTTTTTPAPPTSTASESMSTASPQASSSSAGFEVSSSYRQVNSPWSKHFSTVDHSNNSNSASYFGEWMPIVRNRAPSQRQSRSRLLNNTWNSQDRFRDFRQKSRNFGPAYDLPLFEQTGSVINYTRTGDDNFDSFRTPNDRFPSRFGSFPRLHSASSSPERSNSLPLIFAAGSNNSNSQNISMATLRQVTNIKHRLKQLGFGMLPIVIQVDPKADQADSNLGALDSVSSDQIASIGNIIANETRKKSSKFTDLEDPLNKFGKSSARKLSSNVGGEQKSYYFPPPPAYPSAGQPFQQPRFASPKLNSVANQELPVIKFGKKASSNLAGKNGGKAYAHNEILSGYPSDAHKVYAEPETFKIGGDVFLPSSSSGQPTYLKPPRNGTISDKKWKRKSPTRVAGFKASPQPLTILGDLGNDYHVSRFYETGADYANLIDSVPSVDQKYAMGDGKHHPPGAADDLYFTRYSSSRIRPEYDYGMPPMLTQEAFDYLFPSPSHRTWSWLDKLLNQSNSTLKTKRTGVNESRLKKFLNFVG